MKSKRTDREAEAMGLHPTHIDTHMGALVARPDFLDRYLKVGIEKGLCVLGVGGHSTFARMENRVALEELQERLEDLKAMVDPELRKVMARKGLS
jgi:hypothetical protein